MKLAHLACAVVFGAVAVLGDKTITLDCAKHKELCKADCWHRNCVKPNFNPKTNGGTNKGLLSSGGDKTGNRKKSGYDHSATIPDPCKDNGAFNKDGVTYTSIEEYPFASTVEGGTGTSLRCVTSNENSVQGGEIGSFQGSLIVTFANINVVAEDDANFKGVDWCAPEENGGTTTCQNDGYQFVFTGQDFVLDTRNTQNAMKRSIEWMG